MIRPVLLLLTLAAACGGSATHADVAPLPPAPPTRSLAPNATFADLVDVARALDAASLGDSRSHCLLSWSSLEADLVVPLSPLPAPWTDAATTLAAHPDDGVYVFSAFGPRGVPGPLTVVPFTRILAPPPSRPIVVLFLTSHGVYARPAYEPSVDAAPPVPIADVPAGIALLTPPSGTTLGAIVVTADAATPLVRLRALLTRLAPLPAPVTLAVALPADTTLDAAPVPADDHAAACPRGLPPVPAGTVPGNIGPESIGVVGSIYASWASVAASCTRRAHVTRAGDLTVDLRIAGDGTVSLACAQLDTLADATVRRCLLDAIRGSHFPAPDPAGSVIDASYSYRATRNGMSDAQTPLCPEPSSP